MYKKKCHKSNNKSWNKNSLKKDTEKQSLWNKMIINQSCKPVSDNFLL